MFVVLREAAEFSSYLARMIKPADRTKRPIARAVTIMIIIEEPAPKIVAVGPYIHVEPAS